MDSGGRFVFAIVIVKRLYGGLGKNFMNPALGARAFLLSWPALISLWVKAKPLADSSFPLLKSISREALSPDVIAAATPLAKMKQGFLPSTPMPSVDGDIVSTLRDMAVGSIAGCIGEVSAITCLSRRVFI